MIECILAIVEMLLVIAALVLSVMHGVAMLRKSDIDKRITYLLITIILLTLSFLFFAVNTTMQFLIGDLSLFTIIAGIVRAMWLVLEVMILNRSTTEKIMLMKTNKNIK